MVLGVYGYIGVSNCLKAIYFIILQIFETNLKFVYLLFTGCKWDKEYTETEIYFVAAFIGSGGAGILISSLSIVADLIGKNKESSAFVYGIMSLVDKVSNGKWIELTLTHTIS